jgi:threonine/homoserine/homoserine lactone efflux protein
MSDALVLAIGVAFSPIPIAAATLILGGAKPRAVGSFFALGWLIGVTGSVAVLIAVVAAAGTSDQSPLWIAVPELVLGLAFLALAVHIWRGRRRNVSDAPPRWLAALDRLTPIRSAALGLLLSAANPKNLALALAAAIALAEADVSSAVTARTAALFVLIGTAGVALPLAISLAAPERARLVLGRLRGWLIRYDAVVLTVLGIVIGAKFFVDGVEDL